jgi:hypothetical protein
MERFTKLNVPADILAIIARPALLKGESKEEYFDLLAGIIEDFDVRDRPEFLWAIQYADCTWEIIRLRRMRALVIDHWRDRGRVALLQDRLPGTYTEIEQRLSELYPDGVDPEIVGARAIIMADANEQLAYLDDAVEKLQRRCDSILQFFEARREVFAHRERERNLNSRQREQLGIEKQRPKSAESGVRAAKKTAA